MVKKLQHGGDRLRHVGTPNNGADQTGRKHPEPCCGVWIPGPPKTASRDDAEKDEALLPRAGETARAGQPSGIFSTQLRRLI
jgi:hypothetical protein